MKRAISLVAVVVLVFGFSACSKATEDKSGEVLETIKGTDITRGHVVELANMLATLNGYKASELTIEQKESLVESAIQYSQEIACILTVVDKKAILTDEKKAEIDDKVTQVYESAANSDDSTSKMSADQVKERFEAAGVSEKIMRWFFESQAYVDAYTVELEAKNPISEDDIQKYYTENKETLSGEQSAHLYHILVGDENHSDKDREKAKQILEQIKAGEDFAEMAKEHSIDSSNSGSGGDLGDCKKDGSFVPEFEEAAFLLSEGEISDIVETQFGFHIIKATDVKTGGQLSLEDAREDIISKINTQAYEKEVEKLGKKLKISKKLAGKYKEELSDEMMQ